MLLLIGFVAVLFGYTLVCYLRKRSLSPLLTIMGMFGHLFRAHKFFFMLLLCAVGLHLWGHINLGSTAYNATGFDMLTHTLFGFFVIATMDRMDLFLGRGKRIPLLFALALTFHFGHEIQEEIQKLIPGLASQVSTEFINQARDLGFNLIGMMGYLIGFHLRISRIK